MIYVPLTFHIHLYCQTVSNFHIQKNIIYLPGRNSTEHVLYISYIFSLSKFVSGKKLNKNEIAAKPLYRYITAYIAKAMIRIVMIGIVK